MTVFTKAIADGWRRLSAAQRWALVGGVVAVALLLDYTLVPILARTPHTDWSGPRSVLNGVAHFAGNGLVVGVLAAALWHVGWLMQWPRLRAGGRWMLGAVLLSGLWVQVFKQVIGRPRPRMLVNEGAWLPHPFDFTPSYDSFPSGHSITIWAILPLLCAMAPRWQPLWLALALVIMAGRIVGGNHFVSDVLAAVLLGLVIGDYARRRWRDEVDAEERP